MRRILVALVVIVAFLGAGAGFALGDTNGDYYTGCLNSGGVLTKVAEGDQPLSPCAPNVQQVTLAGGEMAAYGLAIAEFLPAGVGSPGSRRSFGYFLIQKV